MRAKINSFRCTSRPDKSSRGSGSVIPCESASKSSTEKSVEPSYVSNSHDKVPEKIPAIAVISSPLLFKSSIA